MAGSRSRRSRSASPTFAIPNIASRIGGSPQHPVGNGLLAEQFPAERRGFAISAHIAGGNVGTVIVAIVGVPLIALLGWRWTSVIFGVPAIVIAVLILLLVKERGTDRAAAIASGSVRTRSGGSSATATCAGCTSRRRSAAAGAASAWSTSSC